MPACRAALRAPNLAGVRVLFAPDKFKGSLTAAEAAAHMAGGWQRAWPECRTEIRPVADGGDGTLEVVQAVRGGRLLKTAARDARGRATEAPWLWDEAHHTAWIESALVIGLAGLAPADRDPLTATTAGLGDLLRAALDQGAEKIFLGLGGSATNDAGCGMAAAAGWRFLDADEQDIDPVPARLPQLARLAPPAVAVAVELIALADVRNPLLGPHGASHVYGPQKGASAAEVGQLESALTHLTDIARRDLGAPDPATPGAGAAGGLGYGVMTFFGGRIESGFDTIAELTGLAEAIAAADLVVTGEGRLDAQTGTGKAPAGVARLAHAAGKPVIALAGSVPLTKGEPSGFDAIVSASHETMSLEHAMLNAGPLLEEAAADTARRLRQNNLL